MARIEMKIKPSKTIIKGLGLEQKGPAQRFMASELKRGCDSYVPFAVGPLKNTAQTLPDGVLYPQPYAKKQYHKNNGKSGGQRGKEWDKRFMADHGRQYWESIAKFIGGKT